MARPGGPNCVFGAEFRLRAEFRLWAEFRLQWSERPNFVFARISSSGPNFVFEFRLRAQFELRLLSSNFVFIVFGIRASGGYEMGTRFAVSMHICIHVHIYICTYIHLYIHICTNLNTYIHVLLVISISIQIPINPIYILFQFIYLYKNQINSQLLHAAVFSRTQAGPLVCGVLLNASSAASSRKNHGTRTT